MKWFQLNFIYCSSGVQVQRLVVGTIPPVLFLFLLMCSQFCKDVHQFPSCTATHHKPFKLKCKKLCRSLSCRRNFSELGFNQRCQLKIDIHWCIFQGFKFPTCFNGDNPPILPDLSFPYRLIDLAQIVWITHALECGYNFNAAHAHTHRFQLNYLIWILKLIMRAPRNWVIKLHQLLVGANNAI